MFLDKILESLEIFYSNEVLILTLLIFLALASITDIKSFKISNKLNGAFLVLRFLLIPLIGFSVLDLLGGAIGFFALLIPAMIMMHKMGGDIKCMGVLGLYLGSYAVLPFIMLSCILGAGYFMLSFSFGKKIKIIPFAPFFLGAHVLLAIFVNLL